MRDLIIEKLIYSMWYKELKECGGDVKFSDLTDTQLLCIFETSIKHATGKQI